MEENDLNESIKIEASNKLIELKNNSIEDLKKIYNIVIVPTKKEVEEPLEITGSITDGLDNYYNNLTLSDKKDIIALSSPLKELINMLIDLEDDKYNKVIEEKNLIDIVLCGGLHPGCQRADPGRIYRHLLFWAFHSVQSHLIH